MYQLGEQQITITILLKICQLMRLFFAKPHEKLHKYNFAALFLPLIDLQKNRLAYFLIWSQNHENQAHFILFLIFVRTEGN